MTGLRYNERVTAATQSKPEIRISSDRVKWSENTYVLGTGFTPNRMAVSHLLRPDGSEYNVLRLRIDARGEFSHKVDTTMLDKGTFTVWVEDEPSKAVSNRVRFTVE
jgi:hypothetical protein